MRVKFCGKSEIGSDKVNFVLSKVTLREERDHGNSRKYFLFYLSISSRQKSLCRKLIKLKTAIWISCKWLQYKIYIKIITHENRVRSARKMMITQNYGSNSDIKNQSVSLKR